MSVLNVDNYFPRPTRLGGKIPEVKPHKPEAAEPKAEHNEEKPKEEPKPAPKVNVELSEESDQEEEEEESDVGEWGAMEFLCLVRVRSGVSNFISDIDNSGVIEGDNDEPQDMGDANLEVKCSCKFSYSVHRCLYLSFDLTGD